MDSFFTETLGFSPDVFSYILLPGLIFFARIFDVSINTVRIIYVLGGRRVMATFLGFFESFVWLMAIQQIFQHLNNWVCYVAYPAGFATGIFVGMIIEERIAYGKVIVRIITRKDISPLREYLQHEGIRYSVLESTGKDGEEYIVFTVLERDRLEDLLGVVKAHIPTAFFTVGRVNQAADGTMLMKETSRWSIASWLKGVRRN
jgi:uncharacterized protein YebE (UPF0316 family)